MVAVSLLLLLPPPPMSSCQHRVQRGARGVPALAHYLNLPPRGTNNRLALRASAPPPVYIAAESSVSFSLSFLPFQTEKRFFLSHTHVFSTLRNSIVWMR